MSLDYYASERFIHDDLVQKAENTVELIYSIWKKNGKIDPTLLTWPAEKIKDDKGETIQGCCVMALPEDRNLHHRAITAGVERSKAYGLLLLDQSNGEVKLLLETPHGTRSWTIPIIKSADVQRLGSPTVKDNEECIGLIWRPNRGEA